jgi:O-succinylbenzoate synthase
MHYACGLGTGQLLSADIASIPIDRGMMAVESVVPSLELIEKYSISPDRLNWWRTRVRETWNAGAKDWILREGWTW